MQTGILKGAHVAPITLVTFRESSALPPPALSWAEAKINLAIKYECPELELDMAKVFVLVEGRGV